MRRTRAALFSALCVIVSCESHAPPEPVATLAKVAQADIGVLGTAVWEKQTPATLPPMRGNTVIGYDGHRTILFGGSDATHDLNDTWAWDGHDFEEQHPAVVPPARASHAMAYDAARNRLVLFGGKSCAGTSCVTRSDTWEWDGTSWTAGPDGPPRSLHAMAYDALRKRIVLFGGCSDAACTSPSNETWEYDGAAWQRVTPATSPLARTRTTLSFDGQHIVLFGGAIQRIPLPAVHDTWIFDGTTWTEPTLDSSPIERFDAAMTYDPARRRVVLFAGRGCTYCSPYEETWEWDGAAWVERSPQPLAPPDATRYAMTWDVGRARGVLVRPSFDEPLELREYHAFANPCASAADCDGFQCDGRLCCAVSCGPCADCDLTGTACAPVRRRDDAESCTGAFTCASDATCKKKNGQVCARGDECASGTCAEGACCEVERCAPFACGANGSCRSTCDADVDCAPGFVCRGGACRAPGGHCEGNVAVDPNGARADCGAFACKLGACAPRCVTSDDCADGMACSGEGACVAAPLPKVAEGCSLGAGATRGGAPGAAVALALGAALTRRRRRRAHR